MAVTFDTPVFVTEVGVDRFRVFRGSRIPEGVARKEPTDLHGFYHISGPLDSYYRLEPPQGDVTRAEVVDWLTIARRLGCVVEPHDEFSGR